MSETYGAKALSIAMSQVGVKETPAGSNSGPQVSGYQRVTRAYNAPWCASFCQWAYVKAGAPQPCNSGYVPTLKTWYETRHRGLTRVEVRPGDFVMYDWAKKDGVADHIGIFREWLDEKKQTFAAVEGNTSVSNQSNGGQVMVRFRDVKDVILFARPVASRLPVGTKFDPVTGAAKKSLLRYLGRH